MTNRVGRNLHPDFYDDAVTLEISTVCHLRLLILNRRQSSVGSNSTIDMSRSFDLDERIFIALAQEDHNNVYCIRRKHGRTRVHSL